MHAEDPADVSARGALIGLVGDRHQVDGLACPLGGRGGEAIAGAVDGLDGKGARAADDEDQLSKWLKEASKVESALVWLDRY